MNFCPLQNCKILKIRFITFTHYLYLGLDFVTNMRIGATKVKEGGFMLSLF